MMSTPKPKGYSGLQIGLHWAVAMLVVIQFLGHDGIEHAWDAFRDGEAALVTSTVVLHIGTGATILLLALWRLWLRNTRGVPGLPEKEPAALRFVARATHILIYVLLIGLPVSGALAWFGGVGPAAVAHSRATTVLLVLVGLHVVGAFYQQMALKTNVLTRIVVADD